MKFIVSSVCFFYARGLKFIALAYQLDVESCNWINNWQMCYTRMISEREKLTINYMHG